MQYQIETTSQIGFLVREKRKSMGLTQVNAAGLLGVGVRFLSELENGKKSISLEKVIQVMQGLGLQLLVETEKESGRYE
ncbi:MAG: helix-turn-helix domain-containing protein [Spirochaetota bacterium]